MKRENKIESTLNDLDNTSYKRIQQYKASTIKDTSILYNTAHLNNEYI